MKHTFSIIYYNRRILIAGSSVCTVLMTAKVTVLLLIMMRRGAGAARPGTMLRFQAGRQPGNWYEIQQGSQMI